MKQKKIILYIFHVSSIGGGSYCLLNMVKKLDWESFYPIILLKNKGPLCTELGMLGATVIVEKTISIVPYNVSLFNIKSISQIFLIFRSLIKVKYWIIKTRADIVHLNTMTMYPYALPAYKLGRKVIIHIREHWPENEHRIQLKFAKRMIQKYADKIIAINETSSEIFNTSKKAQIIYDWIDFDNRDDKIDFIELFGHDSQSYKVFLFLGGTMRIKGALEVVEVFSKHLSSKIVRLLLVGCDKKEIEYIGIKGILKRILAFLKYYTYSDKVKLLAQKDDRIVSIPATHQVKSLFEQSFCVVSFFSIPHANLPVAEATWLGKPSIAADTPESKEYSDGGKAALLFKLNDKEDFKNKILFALENEELILKNAIRAMSNIKEKFDLNRNSYNLNNVYKDLIIQKEV